MSPITKSKILMKYRASESRTDRTLRMQPKLDREYIVPVLLKSVQILDLLGEIPDGLRIERIHKETGIAKTTVYRIVRTLVVSGHLCHADNGTYAIAGNRSLGSKLRPVLRACLDRNLTEDIRDLPRLIAMK